MPTKPRIVTVTNNSVDVLNAVRNSASINYQNYVPVATADAESLRTIGAIIMDSPNLQNEFINALVNRIGRTIYTSRTYSNPWAILKKGMLDFGETEQEIFVDLCKTYNYSAEEAESKVFQREIPVVHSAYRVMNFQNFYKVTIQQRDLKMAFLSWSGVDDLIAKIVESMYKSANYDEFIVMKYLLAKHILAGHLKPVEIGAVSAENANAIVTTIKGTSNAFNFLSNDYTITGVPQNSEYSRQYVVMNAKFDAIMDVNVLAAAFHMEKAEFMGRRAMVDSFGNLDTARLAEIFATDSTYDEISAADLALLDAVPAVLIDEDFFQIYDNLIEFTEQYNAQGLYWNYFLHTWKTFSVSPFSNAAVFTPVAPAITSVTVSPSTLANPAVGSTQGLTVNVATKGFAPEQVNWTSDSDKVTVNKAGVIKIVTALAKNETVHIKATSVFDSTKSGQCTISGPTA